MTTVTQVKSKKRTLLRENNQSIVFKIPRQVLEALSDSNEEIIDSYLRFMQNDIQNKYYNPVYLEKEFSHYDGETITVYSRVKCSELCSSILDKIMEVESEKESLDKFLSIVLESQGNNNNNFDDLIEKRNELKYVIKELKDLI